VVSRYGGVAFASSMDQIGPVTRDVADCAAMMDIMKGKDPLDATSLDLPEGSYLDALGGSIAGKRIGLPRECFGDGVDADVKKQVLAAAEKLRGLGAVVEEIDMPFLDYVGATYLALSTAEGSSNMAKFDGVKYGFRAEGAHSLEDIYRKTRSEGFGPEVMKRILFGTFVLSAGHYDVYYEKALRVRALITQRFDEIFERYDAILCPTVPHTAPLLGEEMDDRQRDLAEMFTAGANLAGLPAISVPCGFDSKGLPVGAQIIGQRLADDLVLNLGHALQTVGEGVDV